MNRTGIVAVVFVSIRGVGGIASGHALPLLQTNGYGPRIAAG